MITKTLIIINHNSSAASITSELRRELSRSWLGFYEDVEASLARELRRRSSRPVAVRFYFDLSEEFGYNSKYFEFLSAEALEAEAARRAARRAAQLGVDNG